MSRIVNQRFLFWLLSAYFLLTAMRDLYYEEILMAFGSASMSIGLMLVAVGFYARNRKVQWLTYGLIAVYISIFLVELIKRL
jgi:hypothetical protein